jgi:hypothetical protein
MRISKLIISPWGVKNNIKIDMETLLDLFNKKAYLFAQN